MSRERFRCRQCQMNFERETGSVLPEELQCPACQTRDVERQDFSARLLEYLRSLQYSGGG